MPPQNLMQLQRCAHAMGRLSTFNIKILKHWHRLFRNILSNMISLSEPYLRKLLTIAWLQLGNSLKTYNMEKDLSCLVLAEKVFCSCLLYDYYLVAVHTSQITLGPRENPAPPHACNFWWPPLCSIVITMADPAKNSYLRHLSKFTRKQLFRYPRLKMCNIFIFFISSWKRNITFHFPREL